jgi:hypothetical protein
MILVTGATGNVGSELGPVGCGTKPFEFEVVEEQVAVDHVARQTLDKKGMT